MIIWEDKGSIRTEDKVSSATQIFIVCKQAIDLEVENSLILAHYIEVYCDYLQSIKNCLLEVAKRFISRLTLSLSFRKP